MVFGSLCLGLFLAKNQKESRPKSHRTPTRHPPGSIQKPGPEPRPPDPPPGLPRSANAPPSARRPPPVAHLSIWGGLVVGLGGAASALASVRILVGVW